MAKFLVTFNHEKCKGCELCKNFCPKGLIAMGTKVNSKGYYTAEMTDQALCIGCASCALMCPDGAIEVFREDT